MKPTPVASRLVFGALVLATCAAFFVTQRVKRAPTAVQYAGTFTRLFSPNGDHVRDQALFRLKLKQADDARIVVIDSTGDRVRTLADHSLAAGRPFTVHWDGRRSDGALAPDGSYQLRVTLRRQGRSITVPRRFRLDTAPPRLRVTSIGPERTEEPRPELLPSSSGGVEVHFRGPATQTPRFRVYRTTNPRAPRLVARFTGEKGSHTARWNGRLADGRRAPPGTYLVVVSEADAAGNVGSSVPLPPRPKAVVGHGGVTVRPLAVEAQTLPLRAGTRASFLVDARGRSYSWDVRRVGAPRPVVQGVGARGDLKLRLPRRARSGVYLFEASIGAPRRAGGSGGGRAGGKSRRAGGSGGGRAKAGRGSQRSGRASAPPDIAIPFAVQHPARHGHRRVLVVLPEIDWLARAPIDDDGNGMPNLLALGQRVATARALARTPAGFERSQAPLLRWLDREHDGYDVTTDLALARGEGPPIAGHRGVLLAGDERWLPAALGQRLREFARRGGTVASLGTGSLRRTVALTADSLVRPGAPTARDLFGARLGPLQRKPVELLNGARDTIGLFAGSAGAFGGFDVYEPTLALPPGAEPDAYAADAAGRKVIVAYPYGKGLVIRTGLPGWSARLAHDPDVAAVTRRIWGILAR